MTLHTWCWATLVFCCFLTACGGGSPCEEYCLESREKLIKNYGVSPEAVDCSASMWDEADTCAKCGALFMEEYQINPTLGCDKF